MFGMMKQEKSDYKETVNGLTAVFKTNMGEFEAELYVKEAPETVWNFVNLAEGRQKTNKEGPFFDGLIFHRVIRGFMIQGGCPEGSGRGGPGYRFKDEFSPNLKHSSEGILSMANAGPNSNGSQFFITLGPTPHLNGGHAVFGKVIRGMDVVKKIGDAPTGMQDRPKSDIKIEHVEIKRS